MQQPQLPETDVSRHLGQRVAKWGRGNEWLSVPGTIFLLKSWKDNWIGYMEESKEIFILSAMLFPTEKNNTQQDFHKEHVARNSLSP